MNTENRIKWIYWAMTLPFVVTMLMAAVMLLAGAESNVQGIIQLGYPVYLCKILGIAKLLGGLTILQDRSSRLKEWAYAGYTFNLLGAAASHAFVGDSAGKVATPLIILGFVLTSCWLWRKRVPLQETDRSADDPSAYLASPVR